jgi:hypothetical protein
MPVGLDPEAVIRHAETWLAEFGDMADGNGSACARIVRNLIAIEAKSRTDLTDLKTRMYREITLHGRITGDLCNKGEQSWAPTLTA